MAMGGLAISAAISGLDAVQHGFGALIRSAAAAAAALEAAPKPRAARPAEPPKPKVRLPVWTEEFGQSVDAGLLSGIRDETAAAGRGAAEHALFLRLKAVLDPDPDEAPLAREIADFCAIPANAEAAAEIDAAVLLARVVRLARRLNRMAGGIQSLRAAADRAVADDAVRITGLLARIDDINGRIRHAENGLADCTALAAEREAAVTELSGILAIGRFQRENGDLVLFAGKGLSLIDRAPAIVTHVPVSSVAADTVFNPLLAGDSDLADAIAGGSLAGNLAMRDVVLPGMGDELDQLARAIAAAANRVHNRSGAPAREILGSRVFPAPERQRIVLGPGDVRLTLCGPEGEPAAAESLKSLLGGASATIAGIAAALGAFFSRVRPGGEAWAACEDGRIRIRIPESENLGLTLCDLDEAGAPADLPVALDSGGKGFPEETGRGFCHFLGLNDLLTLPSVSGRLESRPLPPNWRAANAVTLCFVLADGGTQILKTAIRETAAGLARRISGHVGLKAARISARVAAGPEGDRLVILQRNGRPFAVGEASPGGLLAALALAPPPTGAAFALAVRPGIAEDPRGLDFALPGGGPTLARALAQALGAPVRLRRAGETEARPRPPSAFAAEALAAVAARALAFDTERDTLGQVIATLENSRGRKGGLDLEAELAELALFQQAYGVSAKALDATRDLFKVLDSPG